MDAGVLNARRSGGGVRVGVLALVMIVVVMLLGGVGRAAEVMPPKPPAYFNDYAKVVSPGVAEDLNQQLEQFEKDTSNQVWVVIYPKMQSDSSIDDYTQRVAESWGVGQKKVNNGVVFFLFIEDQDQHEREFIQVGRGLEGALPDATTKQIIDEVGPHLKSGHDATDPTIKSKEYEAGLRGAVADIIAATKGEYKGNGKTDAEEIKGFLPCVGSAVGAFVLFGLMLLMVHNFGGTFYQRHAQGLSVVENIYMFVFQVAISLMLSGGSSSSSSSSGSSSSGGGSFGGGGAGGSW